MRPSTAWRPVVASVASERLVEVLTATFGNNRELASKYATPEKLNGLIDWTSYGEAWRITAFVMRHGLGASSEQRDAAEIAEYLGRSRSVIQTILSQNGDRCVPRALRIAHYTIGDAPEPAKLTNEFRAPLGLKPEEWGPLVRAKIFSIDQLCAHTAYDLTGLHLIGDARLRLIESRLKGIGRSLKK